MKINVRTSHNVEQCRRSSCWVVAQNKDFQNGSHLYGTTMSTFKINAKWANEEIRQKKVRTGIITNLQQFTENTINQKFSQMNATKDQSS